MHEYDVIVVGGGHAGVEAATVAARRGARVALVTFSRATIGAMSCNPAIGGVGKGHIVREVDAFDGVIGQAADAAAIHYRMLNRSKGAAVRGPRVQADRKRFAQAVQRAVVATPNLKAVEGEATQLCIAGGRITGLTLADGAKLAARSVVLATGTFLGGRMFCGETTSTGGRVGERAATALGEQLVALELPMDRLKTGTPPRLDGRTIDWSRLERQPSDDEPWTMSPMTGGRMLPQLACAITRTNNRTHDLIRGGLDRSPIYGGAIDARGPRYCPSIEDKVVRFGDRDGHQIFLEPEGLDDPLIYPNGISTSLPLDVQAAMIASIEGLERAVIVAPGYAVEYAHIDPLALDRHLAVIGVDGLYCAGQINGTTGYEEAAGQGLVAGANAAAHACGLAPLTLDRASSYIGVMIDDLTLQGVTEPYRMMTARAEYRLRLRADNAGTRLSASAHAIGCLSPRRLEQVGRHEDAIAAIRSALTVTSSATEMHRRGATVTQDGARRPAFEWLASGIEDPDLACPGISSWADPEALAELLEDARYSPYAARQADEVAELRKSDRRQLPTSFDYSDVRGLSAEMVERLHGARPDSLGAASRVRGVTPAALTAILLHLDRAA